MKWQFGNTKCSIKPWKPAFSTAERVWSSSTIKSTIFSVISFALLLSGGSFSRFWMVSKSACWYSTFFVLSIGGLDKFHVFLSLVFLQVFNYVSGVKVPNTAAIMKHLHCISQTLRSCSFFSEVTPHRWHANRSQTQQHVWDHAMLQVLWSAFLTFNGSGYISYFIPISDPVIWARIGLYIRLVHPLLLTPPIRSSACNHYQWVFCVCVGSTTLTSHQTNT